MITLFYGPKTRSTRPRWLLEELGVSYELKRIDLTKGEHKTPDYLKVHPLGKVPAMTDGKETFFESSAMVLYLADKFPEKQLAPTAESPDRPEFLQWMFYCGGAYDEAIVNYFYHTQLLPEGQRMPQVAEYSKQIVQKMSEVLESTLKDRDYLMGKHFSAVDVVLTSLVLFATRLKLLENFPTLQAYGKRASDRPAFQRAIKD